MKNPFSFAVIVCCFAVRCANTQDQIREPASEPTSATPVAEAPAETAAPTLLPPTNGPLYGIAETFDQFLAGELDAADEEALHQSCQERPRDNPFCSSIQNRKFYEQVRQTRTQEKRKLKTSNRAVRPKIIKGNLANWEDLRKASPQGLLKGFSKIRSTELEVIRNHAISETTCPNNAAIALAAHAEDDLPDHTSIEALASLYAKGAECLTEATERETLFTRAGLFLYISKKYIQAITLFERAAIHDGVFTGRSLYWLYRAHQRAGNQSLARATFAVLKDKYPFAFHTLIADMENNEDPGAVLARSVAPPKRRSLLNTALNSLIEQVEILQQLGFERSAHKVLDWAIATSVESEPELRLYLAELKRVQGDNHGKIALLSEVLYQNPELISRQTMELYFPKAFFSLFEKFAGGVDPYLLLAIARRESAFNVQAVSPANARGLLQVMPATSRRLTKSRKPASPEVNVQVGARYVRELMKRVEWRMHLALAAYNAGPKRATQWDERYRSLSDDLVQFIDLIPFRETRDYVAAVLRNYYWYRRIHEPDDKAYLERLKVMLTRKFPKS